MKRTRKLTEEFSHLQHRWKESDSLAALTHRHIKHCNNCNAAPVLHVVQDEQVRRLRVSGVLEHAPEINFTLRVEKTRLAAVYGQLLYWCIVSRVRFFALSCGWINYKFLYCIVRLNQSLQ